MSTSDGSYEPGMPAPVGGWHDGPSAPPPPQPAGPRPNYAGFGARLGAAVVDWLVILLAMVPFLIWVVATWETEIVVCNAGRSLCENPTGSSVAAMVISMAVFGLGSVLYEVIMTARSGQTLGKRALKIKVVDNRTGDTLGYGKSFGRWLIKVIVGNICFLGYLWPLWDDEKQGLHDKVVGTWVVRV